MRWHLTVMAALILSACASPPPRPAAAPSSAPVAAAVPPLKPGGYYQDDGPGDHPPPNLDGVPDAVPRREPLNPYANRMYVALGQTYVPETELKPFVEEGTASWYGRKFNGGRTSSGEAYDMYAMTAAHPTLPIPSYARVTAMDTGKSVIVRINDRGPFHSNRIIDLSYTAAHKLGITGRGQGRVRVESIDPDKADVAGQLPPGVYVQLGAFSQPDHARALLDRARQDLGLNESQGRIVPANGLHRVTLGPFFAEDEADRIIRRVREALKLQPIKVFR
ncbi:MAG TPA: septal ring lytic transglycosylase RlpA family protein [Thiobacillaceae bacterium]|nr:septal ring lytic transglycosylase RlpA family protein [Thiobacillaceae bacterium]